MHKDNTAKNATKGRVLNREQSFKKNKKMSFKINFRAVNMTTWNT